MLVNRLSLPEDIQVAEILTNKFKLKLRISESMVGTTPGENWRRRKSHATHIEVEDLQVAATFTN